MQKQIKISFTNISSATFDFQIPNFCPNCGKTVAPIVEHSTTSNSSNDTDFLVGLLLRCSDEKCNQYFELEYHGTRSLLQNGNHAHRIDDHPVKQNTIPPVDDNFPAEVSEVSPIFKKTYDQALMAENIGLDQIAGVGYRKAVEFLVKDYLISVKNKPADKIKKDFLMPAINEIDYQPIHDLATAATWIGNDETHYVRTWEDQDIEDMKAFIRSCVFFISSDLSVIKSQEMIAKVKAEKEAKKKQSNS